jgi:hypothetical protein
MAVGIIYVCNADRLDSFRAVDQWREGISELCNVGMIPSLLLVHKADQVTADDPESLTNGKKLDDFCRRARISGWFNTSCVRTSTLSVAHGRVHSEIVSVDSAIQRLTDQILSKTLKQGTGIRCTFMFITETDRW